MADTFHVSTEFSRKILEKYRRLLHEEQAKRSPSPRPALPTQHAPALLMEDSEPAELRPGAQTNPHDYEAAEATEAVDPLNTLETIEPVDASVVTPDITEVLRHEHATLLKAVKTRAQEQILQARRERDVAVMEAREASQAYHQRIEQLEASLRAKEATLNNVQRDAAQLKELYETRQQSLIAKLTSVEEQLRSMSDGNKHRIGLLEAKCHDLERSLSLLEHEKLTILKETADDITTLNRCHEELRQKYVDLLLAMKKQRQKLTVFTAERDALLEEVSSLTDELSSLRERNESLTRELIRADRMVFGKPRK
ncbi:hypothetical protein GMRT_10551 [Giardia muris]|uniref:Coiled-coil protein n=1 Tax=Giardia muris TaxID=5742 RepID=A0A4Z1SMR0_GIAMU|nr:hypothetical protein GMRT_10551 [Giardia muris]|eukprot:TNJ26870.1 hypothetical protein GMRT_10551 [Giardia muris]